jgi:RNA polymerase sigma-70 factor (TIGR02957 family)
MTDVERFETLRPRLFEVAYRMLGTASDAEDVVQDAWLRYSAAPSSGVGSPKAYLTTIVTRLCLDRLKSARAQRETYVGPWLPEPILTDVRLLHEGPEQSLALAESVTLAFMLLLETLTPEERAVFLLREVFEYTHDEIAAMLGMTAAGCRQLLHRAKAHVAARRPRFRAATEEKRQLVGRFVSALRQGNAEALTRVLAEDVGLWGDGGGKVLAARRPVLGRTGVLNLLLGIRRTAPSAGIALEDVALEILDVNGEPAVVIRVAGEVDSVYACAIADGAITAIRVVRNPDKLAYLRRQLADGQVTRDRRPPVA